MTKRANNKHIKATNNMLVCCPSTKF